MRQLPDFAQLVQRYGPAVVNITVKRALPSEQVVPERRFGKDDSFELFKWFRIPPPRGSAPTRGRGSGFIVSADGYVLTNAHVIARANDVTIRLPDRREFKATVIGADRRTDVALLKVEANGLPAVKLGDPMSLAPGTWVVAIGSPLGFENSVTAGIVSATGRVLPTSNYVPLIQTDVVMNPGNSGGPLFNMGGEVVGMNSQILTRTGGYQGLSFAIPIDVVLNVKEQLIAHGRVIEGSLGITLQELTQPLADSLGLASAAGALVSSVETPSPAGRAGLRAGDVVLKFNGAPLEHSGELARRIAESQPGTNATLEIWRNGSTIELTVVVGEVNKTQLAETSVTEEGHGDLITLTNAGTGVRRSAKAPFDSSALRE